MVLNLLPNKRASSQPREMWRQEVPTIPPSLPLFVSIIRDSRGVERLKVRIGNKHGRETLMTKNELQTLIEALQIADSKIAPP